MKPIEEIVKIINDIAEKHGTTFEAMVKCAVELDIFKVNKRV